MISPLRQWHRNLGSAEGSVLFANFLLAGDDRLSATLLKLKTEAKLVFCSLLMISLNRLSKQQGATLGSLKGGHGRNLTGMACNDANATAIRTDDSCDDYVCEWDKINYTLQVLLAVRL